MLNSIKIFVAVLDWGLGHATRCMPIINHLLSHGATVVLGSAGSAGLLFKAEYPNLEYIELPAYNPRYDSDGNMVWAMAKQSARFIGVINDEHEQLKRIQRKHKFDLIIADNRYGMYNQGVPCWLITHQLNIQMPYGVGFLKTGVDALNNYYLKKFDAILVPDIEEGIKLSGKLSTGNNEEVSSKVTFIGPLSRLVKQHSSAQDFELLVLLSGPEPQRSILERKLLRQIKHLELKTLFVQGVPGKKKESWPFEHCKKVSYLNSTEIAEAFSSIPLVVSRSGYSTIMDLAVFSKTALLIPTPGQTEQEYLATYLSENFGFKKTSQNQLNLKSNLELLQQSNNAKQSYQVSPQQYQSKINALLAQFTTYSSQ